MYSLGLIAIKHQTLTEVFKLEYHKASPYFVEIEKYIHDKYPNKHEWIKGNLEDITKDIENFDPREAGLIF